jgi:signal transduction histidine kinase
VTGVYAHASTLSELPRVNWRVVVACGALATVLFAALAMPLGGAFTLARFGATLRVQAITWGLWVVLVPFVVAAARRAHRAGIASLRGLAVHAVAATALALAHATAFGALRWALGLSTTGNVSAVVTATVAFVVGGNFLRYVVIAAAYHGVAYAREARERAVAEARMATDLAEARLAALEQRLHPHFLFNTLNAITALIPGDSRAAQRMVEQLGDLLRAALNAEPGREVPLAAELELLERYTAIELVRFPDRLRVDVRAGSEERAALVPQMLLQPIVENAIRHGVAPRDAAGTVVVAAERREGRLRLSVRDDGVGFGGARTGAQAPIGHLNGGASAASASPGRPDVGGLGIVHTRDRLAAIYGSEFALDIVPNAPTGTVVTIDLPFRTAAAQVEVGSA